MLVHQSAKPLRDVADRSLKRTFIVFCVSFLLAAVPGCVARGFLFAMPWKTKDLHLNEIDWQMPRLSAGTSLAVQEVWVESDFTKPPDYLSLGQNQNETPQLHSLNNAQFSVSTMSIKIYS